MIPMLNDRVREAMSYLMFGYCIRESLEKRQPEGHAQKNSKIIEYKNRGGWLNGIKVCKFCKIDGKWVEQKDIPKEEFDRIMSEIFIKGMKNIGFELKKKTA